MSKAEQPVDDSILDDILAAAPEPQPQPSAQQPEEPVEVGQERPDGALIVDDLGNYATRI